MSSFLRLLLLSCALAIGEVIFLAGLPWFGSRPQGELLFVGTILVMSATICAYSIISKHSIKKKIVLAIMMLMFAIIISTTLIAASDFLGIINCVLGGYQYVSQELVRSATIFNIFIIHLFLLESSKKQQKSRLLISLILTFMLLLFLDATIGEMSNYFPLSDPGIRVSILIIVYTPVIWFIPVTMFILHDRRT